MEHELMKPRVVVTGLGLVTPLGNTVEATWAGLMAGRKGAGPITKDFPRKAKQYILGNPLIAITMTRHDITAEQTRSHSEANIE
jgi:3-oxoacyl-(acyl-carrier-protein) synthase